MIRRAAIVLALALGLAAFAQAGPSVKVLDGSVLVVEGERSTAVTTNARSLDAALSPDGQTVAYTQREEAPAPEAADIVFTSLHLFDRRTRKDRLLLAPTPDDELTKDLKSFHQPTWSLDGGFVYVMASAWVTSDAIHQVNVRTGAHRYVIDGNSLAVIRNGPWRGFLLVSRHLYHPAPEYGAYDPTFVVRPDGQVMMEVPDSADDDAAVERWLGKKGWRAS